MMTQKAFVLGGFALALALAFAPAAQAADSCTKNFSQAVSVGSDLKAASLLLEKAGDCCSTDLSSGEAQGLVGDIKALVANATKAVTEGGGDKGDAGKVMSIALGCAGQPALVAADPNLFSDVFADSANTVELARSPFDPIINNQQPTVSIEQK